MLWLLDGKLEGKKYWLNSLQFCLVHAKALKFHQPLWLSFHIAPIVNSMKGQLLLLAIMHSIEIIVFSLL